MAQRWVKAGAVQGRGRLAPREGWNDSGQESCWRQVESSTENAKIEGH